MPAMTRKSKTITFSLPPDMAGLVRQVMREEGRTMSELLRQAIRLYMDEREWLKQQRIQRRRSCLSENNEAQKGRTDERTE